MNTRWIDVREYPEYAVGHIDGAEVVPLVTLDKTSDDWDRSEPLMLVCRSGRRAEQARQVLAAKHFRSVEVLDGGIEAWRNQGKPLTISKHQPWSMDRQVRITAGSLVLGFCGLGLLTNPKFFLGAGLIGAGLVYAGVSDTCTLASILGRMPWNHSRRATT